MLSPLAPISAPGELKITYSPADAQVTLSKPGESPVKVSSGSPLNLPSGSYALAARTDLGPWRIEDHLFSRRRPGHVIQTRRITRQGEQWLSAQSAERFVCSRRSHRSRPLAN